MAGETTFALLASHFTPSTLLPGTWNYLLEDGKNYLSVDVETGLLRPGGMPNPGPSESFHRPLGEAVCDETAIVDGVRCTRKLIVAEEK